MDDTGCSPVSFEVYCVVPLYVSNRMTMFLFLHLVVFLVQASRWLLVLDFASSHFDRFVIFSFTQELFFSLLNYLIAIFQFFKYSLFFDTVFFEPFVMSLAILGGCICFAAVVFTVVLTLFDYFSTTSVSIPAFLQTGHFSRCFRPF